MKTDRDDLILAFYPNARGFAHVVFEGPLTPVDWGISDVTPRKERADAFGRRLSGLIDRYHPDVLVLRSGSKERELPAIQTAIAAVQTLAEGKGVQTRTVSRKEVQQALRISDHQRDTQSPNRSPSTSPCSHRCCRPPGKFGTGKTGGWDYSTQLRWR